MTICQYILGCMKMTKCDGNVTHTGTTTAKANHLLKRWWCCQKQSGRTSLTCTSSTQLAWAGSPSKRGFPLGYTLFTIGQVVGHVGEISTGGICTNKNF